ncbi:hypothetical protein CANARDRAFT_177892 [[Candida] arabinofermentans NRRL YB-2248]|uniref:Uncharacterized protein n=1 Tax=[Candida] arabinofermentans NRRL YB-2248 TaxID=983967 RepID=A0A1E4SV04_9ASCO|nr:hypothetical protein CANARDRAFT_177892 [[Candida] arabinofermentans NRRL YB-2248]
MNNSTKLVEWPSTDDIDINTNNNILDTFVSRPFNSPTLETIDGGFKENEYENITIQKSSKALELRESNRKFDSPIPQQNDDSLKLRVQQSQSQIESQPQPQLLSVTTPQLVDTTNDELNTGTLRFNSKAKVLVYDSESDCKSIRKTFDSENNSRICSNSLRMINRSINKRLSSFSSAMAVRSPTIMNNNNNTKDNSILKSKVNLNREQESIRAYNCDEVDVEDFMCFFETYERRRMDTEPFLGHFRVKQVESYYENIQNRFIE